MAWDSTTVNGRVPADPFCGEFADLGPEIVANGRLVVFGVPGSLADHPDIATVWSMTFSHFHLVWHDTREGQDHVFYVHDLTATGGPGWTMDPGKNLTGDGSTGPWAVEPVLAADILTDPVGGERRVPGHRGHRRRPDPIPPERGQRPEFPSGRLGLGSRRGA